MGILELITSIFVASLLEVRANIQSWHHEEGKDVFSVESQLSKT